MVETLIPPDRERCQAFRPNTSWSPFALGPADVDDKGHLHGGSRQVDRQYRCPEKPVCIVEEREPDDDGQKGSMSLCADCFVQLFLQDPNRAILLEKLIDARLGGG